MAYERTTWEVGTPHDPDNDNNIEDGIEEAMASAQGAEEMAEDAKATADSWKEPIDDLNERVDSKADQTDLDELSDTVNDLSDTVQEESEKLEAGLDEKLDKVNVVNSLDTTEEGYALDARVGSQIRAEIEQGGTAGMISDEFSEERDYSAEDYCIYNNTLYKFVEDKEAGEWDVGAVEATTVSTEIEENTAEIEENTAMITQIADLLNSLQDQVSNLRDDELD